MLPLQVAIYSIATTSQQKEAVKKFIIIAMWPLLYWWTYIGFCRFCLTNHGTSDIDMVPANIVALIIGSVSWGMVMICALFSTATAKQPEEG